MLGSLAPHPLVKISQPQARCGSPVAASVGGAQKRHRFEEDAPVPLDASHQKEGENRSCYWLLGQPEPPSLLGPLSLSPLPPSSQGRRIFPSATDPRGGTEALDVRAGITTGATGR